ncbi:MAG: 2-hydroxyacyl-CoA dehydratase [Candidatus Cloacimonetes bacterium]|nr:2-hydroxyacyl-CoA dehydratase [Candidatus Cloacimonadota bacterium]
MQVGFTTSFPVEIIFAAGHTPVDLNNIFINNEPQKRVQEAEFKGFPRNICSWIKGIYDTVLVSDIKTVIGVVQGDCSNTHSLMSLLQDKGVEVIPFSFPYNKDRKMLEREIKKLEVRFQVTDHQVQEVKERLDEIRKDLLELDRLTYQERKVTGAENHLWLVSSSDFNGDPVKFSKGLRLFLQEANDREPRKLSSNSIDKRQREIRLAYIGVPPIFTDLYQYLPEQRADIIFNEVQRQFSMPYLKEDIVEQYLTFTYPYTVFDRLEDIKREIDNRQIDGIISYSQAFCHRQIDNILLKKYLKLPFLTIEGDQPTCLDERTKLRLESFLDVIRFNMKN